MKSIFFLPVLALLIAAPVRGGGLLPGAEELYPVRYELANMVLLISLYEEALARDPGNAELLTSLAQFWYEKAMLLTTPEAKRDCYERSRDYALAALRGDPVFAEIEEAEGLEEAVRNATNVAALLWYGNSQGQLLGMISPLTAFRLMGPVKAAYQRVVELDRTFWGCSALHALGAFEANLATTPLVNLLFNASLERAREYFEEAISTCPEYLENYCVYARDYAVPKKDKALFEDLLNYVVRAPIGEWPFWNRIAKEDARALLEREEELFR